MTTLERLAGKRPVQGFVCFSRALLGAGLLAGLATPAAQAREWHIGTGQEVRSPAAMNWSQLQPGDVVLIHPGTYTGNAMMQGVLGSATKPIVVKAYNAAQKPVLSDGFTLRGSRWVQVSSLISTVTGWRDGTSPYKNYAAVIVDQGSSNITVSDSIVRDAYLGIGVTNAGLGLA